VIGSGLHLGMRWSLTDQSMRCDDDSYVHEGPIHTDPSHDCAHLLAAANRGMAWRPSGDRAEIKLAEFNAIFIEHLLDRVSAYPSRQEQVLPEVKRYGDWFVESHFAPFPISAAEARQRFCDSLDVETIVRLSPHFFVMKREERAGRRPFRSRPIDLEFGSEDTPIPDAEIANLQVLLRDRLQILIASEK
jgi:hypothetical protein